MNDVKDTYKYHLKVGKEVVHRGICFDLERREVEHQEEFPGSLIHQIGRKTKREAALKWERQGARRPYKYPSGGVRLMADRSVNWREVGKLLVKLAAVSVLGLAGWGLSSTWIPDGGRLGPVDVLVGMVLIAVGCVLLWTVGLVVKWELEHLFPKREG